MAQSAQQYGRQQQQSTYSFPPQQAFPQRFYTPGEEVVLCECQSNDFSDGGPPNGGAPYPYPPQTQPQQHLPYPVASPPPQSQTPSGIRPGGQTQESLQYPPQLQPGQTRRSTYENSSTGFPPQDVSNSGYESRQSHYAPQGAVHQVQAQEQASEYSPSVYSVEEPNHPQQQVPISSQPSYAALPSQMKQPAYPQSQPQQYQQPPSHQPPAPPEALGTALPQSSAYPSFVPSGDPYAPYQRPASFAGGPPQQPTSAYAGGGGGAASNPANFYR